MSLTLNFGMEPFPNGEPLPALPRDTYLALVVQPLGELQVHALGFQLLIELVKGLQLPCHILEHLLVQYGLQPGHVEQVVEDVHPLHLDAPQVLQQLDVGGRGRGIGLL